MAASSALSSKAPQSEQVRAPMPGVPGDALFFISGAPGSELPEALPREILLRLVTSPVQRGVRSRNRGHRHWRPTLVHCLGLLMLPLMAVGFFLAAPSLESGQQTRLSFGIGAGGSLLLPTPTATTPPPTATPRHQPTPPPSSGGGAVISIIQAVFGSYADAAISVARCESGLNPSAVNPTSIGGSHATGVFQILYPSTWNTTSQAGQSPYNAQANTLAAYQIFQRDGYSWREWTCQP